MYKGKTNKGKFTIATCHLYRVKLAEKRANQKMIVEDKGSVISGLLQLLAQSEQYVDDNSKFVKRVTRIVEKYKESQSQK